MGNELGQWLFFIMLFCFKDLPNSVEWHQIRESNVGILAYQPTNAWGKDAALNITNMLQRFPGVLSLYQSRAISHSEELNK